jgi:hypothetical protein
MFRFPQAGAHCLADSPIRRANFFVQRLAGLSQIRANSSIRASGALVPEVFPEAFQGFVGNFPGMAEKA